MIDWNLINIGLESAFTAFAYSVAIYFSKTKEENWDFIKCGKTVSLAAIVAFSMVYWNVTEVIVYGSPFYAFLGILLERVLKIIQLRFIPRFRSIWGI